MTFSYLNGLSSGCGEVGHGPLLAPKGGAHAKTRDDGSSRSWSGSGLWCKPCDGKGAGRTRSADVLQALHELPAVRQQLHSVRAHLSPASRLRLLDRVGGAAVEPELRRPMSDRQLDRQAAPATNGMPRVPMSNHEKPSAPTSNSKHHQTKPDKP